MAHRARLSRNPHPLSGRYITSPTPATVRPPLHVDRLLVPDDEPNLHTRDEDDSIHQYVLEAAASRQGCVSPTCVLIDRFSPRQVSVSPKGDTTTPNLLKRCEELERENADLRRQLEACCRPSPTPPSATAILQDAIGSSVALRQHKLGLTVSHTPIDPADL